MLGDATIAHVPQIVYMADCSIIENIALGIPVSKLTLLALSRLLLRLRSQALSNPHQRVTKPLLESVVSASAAASASVLT